MPEYRSSPKSLGESHAYLSFQEELSRVAPLERPVLLVGERGSGKELAAQHLHYLSQRWENELLSFNCAALSPNLIEAELFGYVRGAFTGASSERKGLFEAADGGTLFLDEIALLPLAAQEKLLRLVEYGEFQRLGSSQTVQVDVRLVAATNSDLPSLVKAGQFKADLLDRLSFEVLYIPPLRMRGNDILLLANYFAAMGSHEFGIFEEGFSFSETALEQLSTYPWPGNIRELKNVVERSLYRSSSPVIEELIINPFHRPYPSCEEASAEEGLNNTQAQEAQPASSAKLPPAPPASKESLLPPQDLLRFREAQQELEQNFLLQALSQNNYRQKDAARSLGLTYDQFRSLYRKHKDSLGL